MYHYDKNFFSEINNPYKAYWLGFIAADGNIRKDFLKTRIELNIKDKSHLEKLKIHIQGDMPIREWNRTQCNNHSCYIEINCKQWGLDLQKYGVVPNKSLILSINWTLIPIQYYIYVIRGYFDGDGSINLYTGRGYEEWELSFIGTEKTLIDFQTILGVNKKISSCGNNFRYCYKNKKDIREVLLKFYNDDIIYLDRKKELVDRFLRLSTTTKEQPSG